MYGARVSGRRRVWLTTGGVLHSCGVHLTGSASVPHEEALVTSSSSLSPAPRLERLMDSADSVRELSFGHPTHPSITQPRTDIKPHTHRLPGHRLTHQP
jgi:hypothetical protein